MESRPRIIVTLLVAISCFVSAFAASAFDLSAPAQPKTAPLASPLPEVVLLHGRVDDCCCEAETVDTYNNGQVYEALSQLTRTPYFSYFKVNYLKPCAFWAETMLCGMTEGGGCGVCECKEEDIPAPWRDKVDATVAHDFIGGKDDAKDIWCECDEESERGMVYINLQLNPERYTGYGGYNATRIWAAIYKENCFQPRHDVGLCLEERTLNRLVSGFHASTTAHICESYWKDGQWMPNVEMFAWKLGKHKEFLENVYFTFLFLSRAVAKVKDVLLNHTYNTGRPEEDAHTLDLMRDLVNAPLLCSPTFDESLMFRGSDSHHLREDLRQRFRNISEIMDCVECETCKVHAKLQMLGIGTALKILLPSFASKPASLQRNEIIALINTLFKFSETIRIIELMRERRDALMGKTAAPAPEVRAEGLPVAKAATTSHPPSAALKATAAKPELPPRESSTENFVIMAISVLSITLVLRLLW